MIRLTTLLTSIACLTTFASAEPFVEFDHAADALYSYSATIRPQATLVFSRSYMAPQVGSRVELQARAALSELSRELAEAGLESGQIANLRAYLVTSSGEDMSPSMDGWNAAFGKHFASAEAPPSRTTIGVSALMDTEALIAIDAIIAAPADSFRELAPTLANARLASHDSAPGSFRAVAPYSSLLVTSGVLADPETSGGSSFGSVERQTQSALEKLDTTLGRWGLGVGDLGFARVLLSPDPAEDADGALDRDGFTTGWENYWRAKRLEAPPVSVFAAPGFSSSGRLVEIEFYAAFPDASGPFIQTPTVGSKPSPVMLREGSESSFLSSSVAIARDASKTWLAGAIATDRSEIYGQGVEALLTLEERMARAGLAFEDTAQLRAYLVVGDAFRTRFNHWNNAYKRFFDHPKLNPGKPVRTAFPIETLPRGALIEIEILAASRD